MRVIDTTKRRLRDDNGFTMMELMVGITLAAVAAAVLFSVFTSTQGAYYESRDITANQSELRIVMGMMTQEIRSAGSDATNIPVDRLGIAAGDQFRIQSDLNADGAINSFDEPSEQITYIYDSSAETITRQTGAGDIVLLGGVKNFQVEYLDAVGNAITPLPLDADTRNLVRALRLSVTVEQENDGVSRAWSSTVAIRNDPPAN